MNNRKASNDSTLVAGLLGIAFVVLKLCGVIDWSWWWVTMPFWCGFALVIAVVLIVTIVFLVKRSIPKRRN